MLRVVAASLALLAVASVGARAADLPPQKNDEPGAYNCQFLDDKGKYYTALPLMKTDGDYTFESRDSVGSVTNYWINPCKATAQTKCGGGSSCCQVWDPTDKNGQASLGKTDTAAPQAGALPEQADKGGFTIQFTGGTADPTSGAARQMEIDFICDESADPGTPVYGGESPSLHYNIKWASKYGCPQPRGLSGGSIIMIIVACLVFVYIVGGVIFQKFVRHAEGIEIFPHVEFWASVPGLIKDGALFIGSKTCCRNGGYGQV